MSWDAIGAMGEWAGAIVVVATLFYLAKQIRQSNQMSRSSASREMMAQFDDLNRLYATDPSIRAVLLKKDTLSREEDEVLYAFTLMYCNAWATAQILFDQGQIEKQWFDSVLKDVEVEISRWPSIREPINRWLSNYPDMRNYEVFRAQKSQH
jgi:hypothetical protein